MLVLYLATSDLQLQLALALYQYTLVPLYERQMHS